MRIVKLSVGTLLDIADELFPFALAEPWDNCGLQIGDPHGDVRAMAFALDPLPQTVRFAAERGCRVLVTHHPVLLQPCKSIVSTDLTGRTLLDAAIAGVSILSLHTNLDAADGGLNEYLARLLGLQSLKTPLPATCARTGTLPRPMTVGELARHAAISLNIPDLRLVGDAELVVSTVFVASGSGMGYLGDALRVGADIMITGDVRYHAAREALERGMPVIDAGHFGLEKHAIDLLCDRFSRELDQRHYDIVYHPCGCEREPFTAVSIGVEEEEYGERSTPAS